MKRLALAVVLAFLAGLVAATLLLGKGELPLFDKYFGGTLNQRISTLEDWAHEFSRDAEDTLVDNWNWTGDLAAKHATLEARINSLEWRLAQSQSSQTAGSSAQTGSSTTSPPANGNGATSTSTSETGGSETPGTTPEGAITEIRYVVTGDRSGGWPESCPEPSRRPAFGDPSNENGHEDVSGYAQVGPFTQELATGQATERDDGVWVFQSYEVEGPGTYRLSRTLSNQCNAR